MARRIEVCVEYDIGAGESVSTAVVRAASAVKGCEPSELGPLAHSVDPNALDALFTALEDGTPRTGGRVSFVYSDCHISVDNGEYLTIEPLDDLLSPSRPVQREHD